MALVEKSACIGQKKALRSEKCLNVESIDHVPLCFVQNLLQTPSPRLATTARQKRSAAIEQRGTEDPLVARPYRLNFTLPKPLSRIHLAFVERRDVESEVMKSELEGLIMALEIHVDDPTDEIQRRLDASCRFQEIKHTHETSSIDHEFLH